VRPFLRVLLLVVLACAVAACGDESESSTTVATIPPGTTTSTSPPVTAPTPVVPEVGPDAWDRSGLPDDLVRVEVGDDPQLLVDDHPPGTAFLFAAGIHRQVEITRPKDGNHFLGEPGAILDGEGEAAFAIVAYVDGEEVEGVVIRGLVVENYAPPVQLAPLGGGSGIGWSIEFNEVRESAAAGIQLGDGSVARHNHVHHNRQIGVKTGTPTTGVVIAANDVSFNNYEDEHEYDFEAGGMKIVNSTDVTIEGNVVHSNHGPGIWTDGNNVGSRIVGNISRDNYGPGIFHEISYDALIADNLVEGNAFRFYVGGILVASSSGVEVTRNAVLGNDGGVVAIQEDRGGGTLGEFLVDRLSVHGNLIAFVEGVHGVIDQREDGEVLARAIEFRANTYQVETVGEPYAWGEEELTRDEWLGIHPTDQ
jgi:hypothetical protein